MSHSEIHEEDGTIHLVERLTGPAIYLGDSQGARPSTEPSPMGILMDPRRENDKNSSLPSNRVYESHEEEEEEEEKKDPAT